MHTWTWAQQHALPYLTCSLLDDWAHGFFTQQWWPRLPEAELGRAIASGFEADGSSHPNLPHKTYRVKQVHGNRVLTTAEHDAEMALLPHGFSNDGVASNSASNPLPEADGLIAEESRRGVWVATADCVPALIADGVTGQVAAVHAGWRGTQQKIVPVAIQRLLKQGSQIHNLRVALGPAIAGEVYQVSTTVAAQVGATVLPGKSDCLLSGNLSDDSDGSAHPPPSELIEQLKALPQGPVLDDPQPGRARLDVRRVNVLQLEQMGLSAEQIAVAPYCTYQQGDRFFSYRRNRIKKVQWSGIVHGS